MTNLNSPCPTVVADQMYGSLSSCARLQEAPKKLESGHQRHGDWEPLVSPKTCAQVRRHMENLISFSRHPPIRENIESKSPSATSNGDVATRVLSIPPLIYREYAAEFRELARTANAESRALYLKMANSWTYAAIRFEAGLELAGEELAADER
jgi:hypothetical protein